jgi:hypothetical protein
MVGFLFLQSEGLSYHLSASNDAPDGLKSLVFGRGHCKHLTEFYRFVEVCRVYTGGGL